MAAFHSDTFFLLCWQAFHLDHWHFFHLLGLYRVLQIYSTHSCHCHISLLSHCTAQAVLSSSSTLFLFWVCLISWLDSFKAPFHRGIAACNAGLLTCILGTTVHLFYFIMFYIVSWMLHWFSLVTFFSMWQFCVSKAACSPHASTHYVVCCSESSDLTQPWISQGIVLHPRPWFSCC